MDDKEMLETEQEEDIDIDIEDVEDSDVDYEEEYAEELEYDDDGNVIIPEEEEGSEVAEEAEDGNAAAPAEEMEPENSAPSAQDKASALEKELADIKRYGAAALKNLGISDGDFKEGLIRLAADAEGVTPEEYKQRLEADAARNSAAQLRQAEIEKADFAALNAIYPETKQYSKISEIPNFERFGELRDLGLSPKEAYIAANPDAIREGVAKSVKQQSLSGTKEHLRSSVPKSTKDSSVRMSRAELMEWRDIFPGKSDKEIMQLYKESNK